MIQQRAKNSIGLSSYFLSVTQELNSGLGHLIVEVSR